MLCVLVLPEWLGMDLAHTHHDSQGSYFYRCLHRLALTITACTEGNLLLRFQLRPKEESDGLFCGAQRKRMQ
jgi:hypothetical protein